MKIIQLALSWSTSRGHDTYGYNICRLDDMDTGKRFKTCGGGYDMTGTVFADWLEDTYQKQLLQLQGNAYYIHSEKFGYIKNPGDNRLYGMTHDQIRNRISLDGGCGLNSIMQIAEMIGLKFERLYNKRGHTTGWLVITDNLKVPT